MYKKIILELCFTQTSQEIFTYFDLSGVGDCLNMHTSK